MKKRLIGIDIGPRGMRIAVLASDRGEISLISVDEVNYDAPAEQIVRLHELLHEGFGLGDRLASCLPASAAFIRQLTFPFSGRKKIAATLPYELGGLLPVSLENYTTAIQPPQREATGARVLAAAVKTASLEDFLRPFDEAGVPLHLLDIAPYAYLAGLKDLLTDGILVCAMDQESCLVLVHSGAVADFRQLPVAAAQTIAQQARALCREATAMQRGSTTGEPLPLFLIGGRATDELASEMAKFRDKVELLSISLGNDQIEAPFVPAVALALRAGNPSETQGFNLRKGRFALKGEWAGLRRALILAASLAGLTLLTLGLAAGLQYSSRSRQAAALQQEMVELYRSSFPAATTVINVPLQMQSAIRALQDEVGLIDNDRPSPVSLLRELSDLPAELAVDLDDFALEGNEVRISGRTNSFEAVNRMAEKFRQSPLFSKVEVGEAKMSVTGQEVIFRMTLLTGGKEAQP